MAIGIGLHRRRGGAAWLISPSATLDMDFANSRYFGKNLSGLTVTRATTTSYAQDLAGNWQSFAANTPRVTNKGLLTEVARTNLFLNSLTPATQTVAVVSATTYTVTVFGSAGSVTLSGAATGTINAGASQTFAASSTSLTVTVSGSPFCVNVEAGAYGTSPIVTAGTSAARAQDLVSVTSVSGLALAAPITIYAQCKLWTATPSAAGRPFSISDGTTSNLLEFYGAAGNTALNAQVMSGGASLFNTSLGTAGITRAKVALGAAAADYRGALNAVLGVAGSTAGSIPTATQIHIGNRFDGARPFEGYIERIAIIQGRLSNAALQAITS